jgi:hypothetical protein
MMQSDPHPVAKYRVIGPPSTLPMIGAVQAPPCACAWGLVGRDRGDQGPGKSRPAEVDVSLDSSFEVETRTHTSESLRAQF